MSNAAIQPQKSQPTREEGVAIASERKAARRRRTGRLRKTVAVIAACAFIGPFGIIATRMAAGKDPALATTRGRDEGLGVGEPGHGQRNGFREARRGRERIELGRIQLGRIELERIGHDGIAGGGHDAAVMSGDAASQHISGAQGSRRVRVKLPPHCRRLEKRLRPSPALAQPAPFS